MRKRIPTWIGSVAVVLALAAPGVAEELDCILQPSVRVDLTSAVPGVLEVVHVDRGDRVTKGNEVARLQSGVEQARLELVRARADVDATIKSAKAALEYQRRRLKRNDELAREMVISDKEIDEISTDFRIAELRLREVTEEQNLARLEVVAAEQMLQQRIVDSPLDGVVVDRFRSAGEYVGEQEKIMTLAQIDPLYVEAIAPVALLKTLEAGDTVTVQPEAPVGGSYEARVTVIDHVVDAASGTFRIRAELPNRDGRLPAGLRCRMAFAAASTSATARASDAR